VDVIYSKIRGEGGIAVVKNGIAILIELLAHYYHTKPGAEPFLWWVLKDFPIVIGSTVESTEPTLILK